MVVMLEKELGMFELSFFRVALKLVEGVAMDITSRAPLAVPAAT